MGEGHRELAEAHPEDFFHCVRTRQQPRGDLELAYMVQIPLVMAMRSHPESKVAFFEPDEELIHMA